MATWTRRSPGAVGSAFSFYLLAALCIAMSTAAWGQKTWTGGGDGASWDQGANWSGGTVPTSADNVLLDNSIVAGSYTVNLPTGATTVSINRLTITPDAGNTITLILPSGNTASIGFEVGDATAGTDDIILDNGAVLKNSSGATSGNGIQVNSTGNGTVRINNGGKYIHNTLRSTAGIVPRLSTVSGTETGIFEYDTPGTGSDAISASGRTYGSLTLTRTAGAAIYTASGSNALTIRGNFLINTGVTFNSTMTGAMNLAGDLENNGTFSPGTGAVTMNGTNAQTMSGNAITFNNLTIDNAAGVSINANETVNGTLTLTSGNIITGTNKIIIAPGGVVTRTSGHIVGNLQKNFATGTNVAQTFEVGDASNYTPVNVTIASVSTAGNVTAKSTTGDHSNISSSTLDANKSVNRNWTLTQDAGLSFTTYDATFNFVNGDLDAGTNTNALIVGKFDAGTWTYPTVGTRTAMSTQATGMTNFSDFQLAEAACSITDLAAGNQTACSPATNTYTQEVIVTFTNPPSTGMLEVNGQQFAIGTSPQTVTLTGLVADGNPVAVTASFTANASCSRTENDLFTAPANCQCASPPVANAGADLATTAGVSAKIGANPTASGGTGTLTINWSPSTGLSSTTASNPTATPSSTTTYTLTVTDANNCVGTDQVTVAVANLVNSHIKGVIGPTNLYDPVLNQVRADIGIKNISSQPIYGPLTAVFRTLTPGPPTITIPNADGGGDGLGCYYDYSNLLGPDNILSPNETSGYKLWIFQEHVNPPVSFRFFADVIGDLDGIPKVVADDQPLAFSFDLQDGTVQEHSDSKLVDNAAEIPATYALHQNHPNPFNPSTMIQFDLPKAGEMTLAIYNLSGQLVKQVASGKFASGRHQVVWDATNERGEAVASGVYLAVLKAGEVKQARRLVLMK